MKMLGKKSVASVLKGILDGLIIIICIVWALAIISFGLASLSGKDLEHDDVVNLRIPYKLEQSGVEGEILSLPKNLFGMPLGMEITRELTLNPTKFWFLLLIFVSITLIVAVFIFILLQLRHFLASLTEGKPFIPANARRIRTIGIIIIASELFFKLAMFVGALIIDGAVKIEGTKLAWGKLIAEIRLPTIFLGIVVLIIAEIFRLGVGMREDQELTI